MEDEERSVKVMGETRVPEGIYQVALRNEGGKNAKYESKYPDMHKGMLAIYNRPNWVLENNGMSFQYILIHTGNTEKHTAGCLLLNNTLNFKTDTGSSSVDAYKEFYPEIAAAILSGEKVTIEYIDVETGK